MDGRRIVAAVISRWTKDGLSGIVWTVKSYRVAKRMCRTSSSTWRARIGISGSHTKVPSCTRPFHALLVLIRSRSARILAVAECSPRASLHLDPFGEFTQKVRSQGRRTGRRIGYFDRGVHDSERGVRTRWMEDRARSDEQQRRRKHQVRRKKGVKWAWRHVKPISSGLCGF